jgi:uncharacterized protein (DUF433 family)
MKFTRITINPNQWGGAPCIRGLHIPVATIVEKVVGGMSHEQILQLYPELDPEDIQEALRFAAQND